MLHELLQFPYVRSIACLNLFFLHIQLPLLTGDLDEEGSYFHDIKGTTAWK